jgi:diguanylate cyclase (GGDEF)-like protein
MGDRDDNDDGSYPADGAPTIGADGSFRLHRDDLVAYQQARGRRVGSLVVIAGNSADIGNTYLVHESVIIGREGSDMVLRDARVSRRHAVVSRDGAAYVVQDNRSTNGTELNGKLLKTQQSLQEGDRILIGETVIKFTLVDDTEAGYLQMMDRLVGTDGLTGLLAKHRFDAALDEALRNACHNRLPLSVMMLDVDHLKAINDRHGHHAGEGTIRQVGRLIAQVLSGKGEACRFGGDEFSAFLLNCRLPAALATAEEIRARVEETDFGLGGDSIRTGISIGVAEMPPGVQSAKPLLDLADQALYRAKARGRNAVSD